MKKALLLLLTLCIAGHSFCCTSIIVGADASANGRPLLWKQRDASSNHNYMDYFASKEGSFGFIGLVGSDDTLRKEVWCGTNEKGFSVMNTVAYGLSPIFDEERPWEGIVMKRALEICVTVNDFEDYIKSLPQPNGLETNFGVSDKNGDAAYFEVHDLGYVRFDVPRNGYLIRTNFAFTGREGEGKGYDRYALVERKMKAHKGKFDAEWIFGKLSMQPIIARPTSIASIVLDGEMLWCETGYSRGCYALPVWVGAGDEIPVPLRKIGAQGSESNEMAYELNVRYRDTRTGKKIDRIINRMRKAEFKSYNDFMAVSKDFGIDIDAVRQYNIAAAERFDMFKQKCVRYLN